MPATHSKAIPKKNAETTNPLRKWEKKLRNAKTEEQRLKAERMIRIHTPKEKKSKKPKKQELTEDQLLDQMARESKKLRKNPDFMTQQQQAELKRQYLERERNLNREKIKNEAKERQDKEQQEKDEQHKAYEQYKKEEAMVNEHLNSHKQLLHEYSENTGVMETFLEKHNGNEKKAKKEHKKQTTNLCYYFEYMINGISKEKEISYEEAQKMYYHTIRMSIEGNSTKDLLQLPASL